MSLAAVLAQLPQAEFVRPAIDWHAVAPELVLLAVGALLTLVDIVGLERSRRYTASLTGLALLLPLIPIATLAIDGIGGEPHPVRRCLRRRRLLADAQGHVPRDRLRRRVAVHPLHRRRRLLGERVLRDAGGVAARHGRHGQRPRPHHHLRGPRAAVDPRLPAGHVAQARPAQERSRPQVLPDGCVRIGHHAVRHVARVRGGRVDQADRHQRRARRCRSATSRRSPSASSS